MSDSIIQQAIQNLLYVELETYSSQRIHRALLEPASAESPWLWCWQAMEQRLIHGNYLLALQYARHASRLFNLVHDADGRARANAEVCIAHYHLGQYAAALQLLDATPMPPQATCAASLALAGYLNTVGLNDLARALEYFEQGMRALEHDPDTAQRVRWQIILKRNAMAAYHYCGELSTARRLSDEAFQLLKTYGVKQYHYTWLLYERGLLEQRVGQLTYALELLRNARTRCEQYPTSMPLRNWIVAAEGHTLRDQGNLVAADATYQLSGWGEGDEGPLMLWVLQERWSEARCAAEARLAAAHASQAIFESTSLKIVLTLLQYLQHGATEAIRDELRQATNAFTSLGFSYHRASVLLLLASVEYELAAFDAGDAALAEALAFGRSAEYYNFAWWHPIYMRKLIDRANSRGIEPDYCQQLMRLRDIQPVQHAQTTLTIRCLGRFEVFVNAKSIALAQWQGYSAGILRMQRLLVYLARHRGSQSISAIAQYVWSDRQDYFDIAANIHVTINGLRRVLEPGLSKGSDSKFILKTTQGYQLAPNITLTIDLDRFTDRISYARKQRAFGYVSEIGEAYYAVEQLYTSGLSIAKPGSDEAEWYRQAFCEALHWLAHDDFENARYETCLQRAQRLLHEDTEDIDTIELLIEAYLAKQNWRAARQIYNRAVRSKYQLSPRISKYFAR